MPSDPHVRASTRVLAVVAGLGAVAFAAWLWPTPAPVAEEVERTPPARGVPAVQRNLTVRGLVYGPYSRYTARLYNCDDACQLLVDGLVIARVGFGEDSGPVDVSEHIARGESAATRLRFENINREGAVAYGFELWGDDTTRLMHEECGQVGQLGCHGNAVFREGVAVWMEAPAYRPEGPPPSGAPAHVVLTVSPAAAAIAPDARVEVDYRFTEDAGTGATLTSRSALFEAPDGRPLAPRLGPYLNTITVPARGSVSWKDRVHLPVEVAEAARARGERAVLLHQTFVGFDAGNHPVSLRATLRVRF